MPDPKPNFPGAAPGRFLGRLPIPEEKRKKIPLLRNFVNVGKSHAPTVWGWDGKAQKTLSQMMGNDREGCCVATTVAKQLGMATAVAPGSAELVATAAEVLRWYHEVGGPGDNGLVVTIALDRLRDMGMMVGNKRYKIDGYVAIDPQDVELCNFAGHHFGGLHVACYLPRDWYQNADDSDTWDLTNSPIVGGHSVPVTAGDGERLRIATWAKQPHVTRRAFHNGRYFDEVYAVLYSNWYDDKGLDANGVNVVALRAALAAIRNGEEPVIPDDPNPTPPNPPTPPTPGNVNLKGTLDFFGQKLPMEMAGMVLGQNGLLANATINTWAVLMDLACIAMCVKARDWVGVAAAVEKLLIDLGLTATRAEKEELIRAFLVRVETAVLTDTAGENR